MQEDNTPPPLPNSRLMNPSRPAADLTNVRPIIVMGIRVHDNDPELARIMRIVIKVAIVIFFLETLSFFIILSNGGYVEESGSNQQITLLSGIFTLVVFGMCVPVAGYWGAKKSDPNALSLFCFGEGLVAAFGGCEFLMTVFTVMSYLQLCDQCSEQFANATVSNCTPAVTAAGGMSGADDEGKTVSRAICEGVLTHWGFWTMIIVSGLIVLAGAVATKFSMRLRIHVLETLELPGSATRQNFSPTHVVPNGVGVVATTTVIQSGMQHYDQPVQGQLVSERDEEIPRARAVV